MAGVGAGIYARKLRVFRVIPEPLSLSEPLRTLVPYSQYY
ncbi:MAG: hypothetical protein DDT35_00420 [Firmicutes bacterium]|nr:hypothetical protein [Bacillota bacterium]